jgi:double-stranded RNA-binding protein Staufen
MCLINELARYNKIQHQYTLTDEQGPAHKKTFYVMLKLGEEEYAASGPSIKKAQHAAADIALQKTQYKHPPPKPPRSMAGNPHLLGNGNPNITPTVELNALAMKRGEPAVYRPIEPPRSQYYPPNYDFRGMYHQRYHYSGRFQRVFYMSLKVGQREFIGEGVTRQTARHNAAEKALSVLQKLPLPCDDSKRPQGEPPVTTVTASTPDVDEGPDGLKSEISLVHEIALKRNLPVDFEVIRESGPPHMRNFVTRCSVGEFSTTGEGNGKKASKKRAAEAMLDKLKTLTPLPPTGVKTKRNPGNKRKNRNLIKVEIQKTDVSYGVGINPISRLIQIQQAKKEKEPVYTLVAERGMPRRREFVIQVQVNDQVCTGVGPSKKLAKRNAAEAMLQHLGYSRPSPQPSKPAIKTGGDGSTPADKKVTFIDHDSSHSSDSASGRQLVPGVLLMPNDGTRPQGSSYVPGRQDNHVPGAPGSFSPKTTAAIAKELLDTGASPTAEALGKAGPPQPSVSPPKQTIPASKQAVSPKQQLLYLANVLGINVQITDFPKGNNKSEYLSLVSLSVPPHMCHGAGASIAASHDMAALTALRALAEMGLDSNDSKSAPPVAPPVVSASASVDPLAAGDGLHIKQEKEKLASSPDLSASKTES